MIITSYRPLHKCSVVITARQDPTKERTYYYTHSPSRVVIGAELITKGWLDLFIRYHASFRNNSWHVLYLGIRMWPILSVHESLMRQILLMHILWLKGQCYQFSKFGSLDQWTDEDLWISINQWPTLIALFKSEVRSRVQVVYS